MIYINPITSLKVSRCYFVYLEKKDMADLDSYNLES